jgi:hypothetical protein
MHLSLVGGINQNNTTNVTYLPAGMPSFFVPGDTAGAYSSGRTLTSVKTLTLNSSFTIPLRGSRHLNLAAGFNAQNQTTGGTILNATSIPPGVSDPKTFPTGTGVSQIGDASSTYGWYLEPQLRLSSRFFISPGIRLDGGSASGSNAGLTVFPKTDVSWIAIDNNSERGADAALWQRVLTTLRLRGAYGLAGVQPPPAARLRLFRQSGAVLDGTTSQTQTVVLASEGNPLIHPERSAEMEGGFDAELLNSRVSFTMTYYHKKRIDAIIQSQLPPSVGGGPSQGVLNGAGSLNLTYLNIGNILNTGLEMTASAQLIQSAPLAWDVNFSLSNNHNKLLRLAQGLSQTSPGGFNSRLVPGYPIDGLWVVPLAGFADANQDSVIEPNELVRGDSTVYIGTQNPRYESTFGTTVAVLNGRLSATALFHYSNGLTLFNSLALQGLATAANAPDATLQQKAIYAYSQKFSSYNGPAGQVSPYLYQTVNTLQWNSASITYTVPDAIAHRLRAHALSLALQGSNLWMHTNYRGKDPNVNVYTSGEGVADFGQLPQPRVWALRVNLTN